MTYKTQEIIAKCLKQFDLRLFEEIGGNIQEKNQDWMKKIKKSTFRAFALRAKKVPYLESRIRNAVFTKTSHYIYNEKWHPAEEKYTHYNTDGNSSLKRLRKYYD